MLDYELCRPPILLVRVREADPDVSTNPHRQRSLDKVLMLRPADREPNLIQLGAEFANIYGAIILIDASCPCYFLQVLDMYECIIPSDKDHSIAENDTQNFWRIAKFPPIPCPRCFRNLCM